MQMNIEKIKADIQQELSAMHDIGMISDEVVADACLNVEMSSDDEVEALGWMKTHEAADLVLFQQGSNSGRGCVAFKGQHQVQEYLWWVHGCHHFRHNQGARHPSHQVQWFTWQLVLECLAPTRSGRA